MLSKKTFPLSTTFNFHFIDYCNFKCKHCFVKKCNEELSFENIKIIIDKISKWSKANNKHTRINLAGGEPLLSKNLQKIIDYIYSKQLKVSIITNGYYLTEEFIKANKNKLSMIGLSIDSFDENINKMIGRCNGTNTLSFEQFKKLCETIKENKIKLKINCCISALNIKEAIGVKIKKLLPDRVKFLRVMTNHLDILTSNIVKISDDQWLRFRQKNKNIAKETVFEDNPYMMNNYLIIDSKGNISRDNLHLKNNSILVQTVKDCIDKLNNWDKNEAILLNGPFQNCSVKIIELNKTKKLCHIVLSFFNRNLNFWVKTKDLWLKKVW